MMDERSLQRITLLVVTLSSFTVPLILSAPNVSVPAIARGLGADAVSVGWVSTAYLLASAVFLLPFGKLADRVGRKRIFLSGLAIIAVAAFVCAAAPSFPALVVARLLQGLGAGMIYATAMALLSSVFPKERRGAVIGVTTSAVYFGLTAGPLVGGWVTHNYGWRMVFILPLPLLAAALALGTTQIKGEWKGAQGESFDYVGTFTYAIAIVALMLGVSKLPTALGWTGVAVGAVGLWAFFHVEHRRKHPVFDVTLFYTNRIFTFSCMASLLMYGATFANTFLMSLYLQHLQGLDAQSAGLVMIAQPIMQALLSPAAGKLSDRIQPRVLASSGMALCFVGLLLLAHAGQDSSIAYVIFNLAVVGTGFALFSSPNMNAIMGSVEPRLYGTAGGSAATVRVLGQMLSMGLITLITAVIMGSVPIEPAHYDLLARTIRLCFYVAAALCVFGIALSLARGQVKR